MAKLGHRSVLGQLFVHGLPTVSMGHIWVIGLLVYPCKIGPRPYVTSILTWMSVTSDFWFFLPVCPDVCSKSQGPR